MKIVRFSKKDNLKFYLFGILEDGFVREILNSPYHELIKYGDDLHRLEDICLLPPVHPQKIVCIATNYLGVSGVKEDMEEPVIFLKGLNAIAKPNDSIHLPFKLNSWGESELGFVIKKSIKNYKKEKNNLSDYILGYLPCNDVSCQNISGRDHHLARSKSVDNFCPVGEYIDTEFQPDNKSIKAYHNGELLREGNTSEFIWDPKKIIEELSKWMTLSPGDLILTGAPKRIRDRQFLENGDEYVVEIEGLPILRNVFLK